MEKKIMNNMFKGAFFQISNNKIQNLANMFFHLLEVSNGKNKI